MEQILREIIEHNRTVMSEARKWNARAGEKVFPVMTEEELTRWIEERLGGAQRLAEIFEPEILRLPGLATEFRDKIERENPYSILVNGRATIVEYSDGYNGPIAPRITIDGAITSWMALPDDGVKLPGGRQVNIVVKSSYYTTWAEGTDVRELKQRMKDRLNENQWMLWIRPHNPFPNFVQNGTKFPDIIIVRYGKCVVTGEDLFAYGTLERNTSSWAVVPKWVPCWNRSQSETEALHTISKAIFEAEEREKRMQSVAPSYEFASMGEMRRRSHFEQGYVPPITVPVNAKEVEFTERGSRWFECQDGHTTKVEKVDWSRYQSGDSISICCSVCKCVGDVKKP